MVRRDRNHPCVLWWEPILNETRYPASFAQRARQAVAEEDPHGLTAADAASAGSENFEIQYSHPDINKNSETGTLDEGNVYGSS